MQNEDNSKCPARADYLVATTGARKTVAIGWKIVPRIVEMTYWIGCLNGTKALERTNNRKKLRLDYEYRICRLNTRKGPSLWMQVA